MQQRHERKYRDIRPAKLPVERADSNDNKSFVASPAETSSQPRRKRSAVAVACDRCRARKVAVSSPVLLQKQPGSSFVMLCDPCFLRMGSKFSFSVQISLVCFTIPYSSATARCSEVYIPILAQPIVHQQLLQSCSRTDFVAETWHPVWCDSISAWWLDHQCPAKHLRSGCPCLGEISRLFEPCAFVLRFSHSVVVILR
ncbi:hypothetical protein BD289DRAFT_258673 [Coniella lustricola]|uniref:Uncharacterized protein n=1 Tax=Coniella lustricola TaxID=2025994 RepID=A0A2T3A845_9PEZI|nr:hypothetical protein BD289DRAFT_258673 [Coniella lustricola]